MAWCSRDIAVDCRTATGGGRITQIALGISVEWDAARLSACHMGRAAILRGVTKELKVAVRVENPGTLDEVTTITLDTKITRDLRITSEISTNRN